MKNKIQIMFVRGLQKALNHDNGPRLPRHWKVITSTLSRFDSLSIVSRQSDLDGVGGISALFSSRVYRYVAVLLMVFMVGIGQMWGTNPSDTVTVHSPGKIAKTNLATAFGRKYETFFSDNASTTNLLVGSNTSSASQASGENKWCCIGSSCGNTSNSISTGFTNEEFVCNAKTSNHKALRVQSTAQTAKIITMVVSGYDSIATLDKDEVQVYAEEYGTNSYGTQSKLTAAKTKAVSSHNKRVYALNASKRYRLTIAYNTSGSTNKTLYAFSLCPTAYGATHNLLNVTRKSGDLAGTKAATKGYAYNVTFEAAEGYTLPSTITVTIGGNPATVGTDYTWNSTTGEFNVPANKVTGAIVVAIEGEISGTPCSATANAGADKNTTVGVGVAMAATAAGEGYTGAWSIKAGSPSTATSQLGTTSSNTMTFTPNTYGTYTLVWTVTDNNDGTCSDSDEATVTVPAPTHSITYNSESLKGQSVSGYPTEFTEGIGKDASDFPALDDVTDYHFYGWSPASIGTDVDEDVEMTATWVAAYDVTFSAGAGSGTVPASFQKWEGAKFNMPGQGDMEAPSGKAFDGWKANGAGDKLAANTEYTMIADDVEFVAQWKDAPTTLFDWTAATTNNIESDNTDLSTASYGTLTTGTSVAGRLFGTNTIAKNNAGYKLGNNDVCIEIKGTSDFQEGDTVIITGQNGGDGNRCFAVAPSTTTDAVADTILTNTIGSSTANSIYKVVITDTQAGAKLRIFRLAGKTMYCKGVKVIRPVPRPVSSTVISLSDLKVNNRSISSDSLAALVEDHSLTLGDEFVDAPEIKFNEHKVITYADALLPATKTTDKVYTVTATENGAGNWEAAQEINSVTYTVTAAKKVPATKYTVSKGTHANGDFTIDPASQEEGGTVTLTATPDEDYVFSAWAVVKTEDGSATGITVDANGQFEMPGYAVTVNATFAADPRAKVLYVTSNTADATKSDDKVYAALKDTYNVKIVGPSSDADQSGYALVVLHESLNGGSDYNKTAVAAAKTGTTPVLNTKAYFYNSGRWAWGTPNAGKKTKGVHVNTSYCNITSHPLFNDLTPDANDSIIILSSINGDNKPIQPIGSFTSGKEGYTLANVPDGCAIHELTPAQRGAVSGKYLLISLYTKDFANLNANGQKLFQNAAAYLIDGSANWTPIVVPTAAAITADPNAAYFVGDNIALTASATGTSAATTYTWYKGDNLADAKEAGAIKAAATAAAGGNTYGVTGCALADAGTYWCVISNGTDCEAAASLEVTVSDVSYDIAFVSAHGTAPSATTGVSYTLPELSADGWAHQGWTANINVTVDAATVDAGDLIANGKLAVFEANVTFTAVWVQEFDVTFNMKGHGATIAKQTILDGNKANEPTAPVAIGYNFGGWFTDEECTEGNEFDFNTAITAATPLYAKWTAFTGCVELWPATSGDAPTAANEVINLQEGSTGGSIVTVSAKDDKFNESFEYTTHGLALKKGGADVIGVTLNSEIAIGTKISVTLYSNNTGARGLNLLTSTGAKIGSGVTLGWADATVGAIETFTYTAEENDGLVGTNGFRLQRNNTVYLKTLKVESCGATIIYHGLTSAVDPTGKGTVTLGASSVREGYTTTATYSDIDEAYEFDEWQISGTGASIADASANPAVITMGTADAVVTLKLKAATPKHTVTYDVKGHGVAPASEDVKEGAKVTKPADPTAENWAFVGWYKETTLENEWNFDVDVMGEENITLYAKWEDESGAIKLFDGEGNLNTTKFVSPAKTTIEINEVEYTCLAQFSANRTSLGGATPSDMVQYNATTDAAKIKMTFYNNNSGVKKAILYKYEEGAESPEKIEIEVPGQTIYTTDYYTFNSSKNRSFYVCMNDRSNIRVLQVKVMDNGTAIQQAGQAGYSLNLNKGRMYVSTSAATSFEGATINVSSEYKVYNNGNMATNSYISFTTTVDKMILKVTRSGGNYYVSQDPENKGTSYNTNKEIELSPAGTWYLGSSNPGSAASFTKIEFIAPKCEAPEFNALANSDICSGDAYVALDGTGTVSDGGSISYKWYAEGSETVLATTATYTPSADGNYYVVALHHVDGYTDNEVTSDVVTVKTHAGTAISEPLADQRGNVDAVVALEVAASGKNLHYAWKECATIDGEYTAVAGAADAASLNVTITEGMDKYYKVVVSSDCGENQESVAHVTQYVPVAQANVTSSIAWDWTKAASVNEIKLTSSTAPKKNEGFVMANGKATIYNNANFESDKLYLEGEYIVREGKYFQGQTIKFNTTVAGAVRVKFSHTGNATEDKPARELYINGVATGEIRDNATAAWSGYIEVPAGEVSITAYYVDPVAKPGQQYIRVPEIEFLTIAHQRTSGYKAGDLGTVCLEDAAVINGAKLYELGGLDGNGYLAFDEITNDKLEAGKPYLFEVTNPSLISFYKQVNAAHADAEIATNGMIGTFHGQDLVPGDGNFYYFSGRHIWRVNDFTVDKITIPANRCYVDMDDVEPAQAPAPGRRRVTLGINGNNAPTDVENVQSDEVQCTKVMINGQLFILRGEKMYDVTGKLVK